MTTPNPALVAAAPILIEAVDQVTNFVNTVLTGDPMQIPVRADAAVKIFIGQIELLAAPLLTAEVGVVQTDITGALANLKTKLQSLSTPAATVAPAAT
jgi:hypothetical protein